MLIDEHYETKHFQILHFTLFLLSSSRPLFLLADDLSSFQQTVHRLESFLQLVQVIAHELAHDQSRGHVVVSASSRCLQIAGTGGLTGMRTVMQVYEIMQHDAANGTMVHFLLLDLAVLFMFLLVPCWNCRAADK